MHEREIGISGMSMKGQSCGLPRFVRRGGFGMYFFFWSREGLILKKGGVDGPEGVVPVLVWVGRPLNGWFIDTP